MDKFIKLEQGLEKLMPSAVSDEAHKAWSEEIELRLQEMEAKEVDLDQAGNRRFRLSGLIAAAAACMVIGFGIAATFYSETSANSASEQIVSQDSSEKRNKSLYEILSSSKIVQSQQEVGFVEEKVHQIPMRKVRYRILDTAKLRDSETGVVVTITEPREEVLIEPVESF